MKYCTVLQNLLLLARFFYYLYSTVAIFFNLKID
jgi:hypothetical protein